MAKQIIDKDRKTFRWRCEHDDCPWESDELPIGKKDLPPPSHECKHKDDEVQW